MSDTARRHSTYSSNLNSFDQIRVASDVIRQEGNALLQLADRPLIDFPKAVDLILGCRGSVIVTGVGKAGWIGQKVSASLASTGTRSHFLHPSEAMHLSLIHI